MKIIILMLIVAVAFVVNAQDACPPNLRSSFQAIATKCKQQPADQQRACAGAAIRASPDFKKYADLCPDPSVKDCLKNALEADCPGITKT